MCLFWGLRMGLCLGLRFFVLCCRRLCGRGGLIGIHGDGFYSMYLSAAPILCPLSFPFPMTWTFWFFIYLCNPSVFILLFLYLQHGYTLQLQIFLIYLLYLTEWDLLTVDMAGDFPRRDRGMGFLPRMGMAPNSLH